MISREAAVVSAIFITLAGLSVWLQFDLLIENDDEISEQEKKDPDYYLENFVSIGMDEEGKQYRIEADRMVHYPQGDRSLLNRPHIIQYDINLTPRHIYADSGWLYNNGEDVLLTGNVKVIQSRSGASTGGTAVGEKMVIRLKNSSIN